MPVILALRRLRLEDQGEPGLHNESDVRLYCYTVYQDSVKGEEGKEEGGKKRK